jgi:FkbM family methyltransferase
LKLDIRDAIKKLWNQLDLTLSFMLFVATFLLVFFLFPFVIAGMVWDLGAHIGQFSLLAAALGHRVVAVEPHEGNLQLFLRSILLNNLQDRVLLFHNALSDHRGRQTLFIPSRNQGAASLFGLFNNAQDDLEDEEQQEVDTVTLDDLYEFLVAEKLLSNPGRSCSNEIAFMKVDVEGLEPRLLRGGRKMLEECQVPHITMEITPTVWSGLGCDVRSSFALRRRWAIRLGIGTAFHSRSQQKGLQKQLIITTRLTFLL